MDGRLIGLGVELRYAINSPTRASHPRPLYLRSCAAEWITKKGKRSLTAPPAGHMAHRCGSKATRDLYLLQMQGNPTMHTLYCLACESLAGC